LTLDGENEPISTGQYVCTAENIAGKSEAIYRIQVSDAEAISITVAENNTASLFATNENGYFFSNLIGKFVLVCAGVSGLLVVLLSLTTCAIRKIYQQQSPDTTITNNGLQTGKIDIELAEVHASSSGSVCMVDNLMSFMDLDRQSWDHFKTTDYSYETSPYEQLLNRNRRTAACREKPLNYGSSAEQMTFKMKIFANTSKYNDSIFQANPYPRDEVVRGGSGRCFNSQACVQPTPQLICKSASFGSKFVFSKTPHLVFCFEKLHHSTESVGVRKRPFLKCQTSPVSRPPGKDLYRNKVTQGPDANSNDNIDKYRQICDQFSPQLQQRLLGTTSQRKGLRLEILKSSNSWREGLLASSQRRGETFGVTWPSFTAPGHLQNNVMSLSDLLLNPFERGHK